jgi:alpha-beta hydrolase superfamily lysophospholipase
VGLLQAHAGVVHREGFFKSHDAELYEQSWRPEGVRPRAILVVVHGLKDHSARYAAAATELARAGYLVTAFDLRGHGRSSGVRVDIASFEDYLRDLDVFLARVRGHEQALPIFELGHSMGGAIVTLHTLTRHPADVRGVILSAPALASSVSGLKVAATRGIAALDPEAGVFNLDLDDFSRDPLTVKMSKEDTLVYQGGAPARTAVGLVDAIDEIQGRMEELRAPLVAMHGTGDKITPPEGSRDLVRRAAATDKTLHLFPRLFHDLLHEPERAEVVSVIRAWLDARTRPSL